MVTLIIILLIEFRNVRKKDFKKILTIVINRKGHGVIIYIEVNASNNQKQFLAINFNGGRHRSGRMCAMYDNNRLSPGVHV